MPLLKPSVDDPLAAGPYCQSLSATVLSITFAAPVDAWLLHSPPAQQHTN